MTAPALDLSPADLTGAYTIDAAHSRVGFVARHAMVTKVRGSFNAFDGHGGARLHRPGPQHGRGRRGGRQRRHPPGAARRAPADQRLLRRPHVPADRPSGPPRSRSVDAETFRLTGDLTLKGVTRPVTLDVEYQGAAKDPYGNVRVGFEGRTTLNRSDFGVTFNAALETGGVLVSEKITVELEISAVKGA